MAFASTLSEWWVWDYPSIWVPITCALLALVRSVITLVANRHQFHFGSLLQIARIYDALNCGLEGPNITRAAVIKAHDGLLFSTNSPINATMIAESTSVGPQREVWQNHAVTSRGYIECLIRLCTKKSVRLHLEELEECDPLRALWEREQAIGTHVALLLIDRWPLWWILLGRFGIRAIFYASFNLSDEPTSIDLLSIDKSVAALKTIYR